LKGVNIFNKIDFNFINLINFKMNKACEFCKKNKLRRKLICNSCNSEHYHCPDCKVAFLSNWCESYENEFNVDCTEQLSRDTISFYYKKIKELNKLISGLSSKYNIRNRHYKTCMECLEDNFKPTDLEFSFDMVVSLEKQNTYNILSLR
jgi:hypothetical protein